MVKKILFIGDIVGAYRSQILIKKLLNNNDKFTLSFTNKKFYLLSNNSKKLRWKLARRFFLYLSRILHFFECLIKVPFADMIYLFPMNHRYIFSAVFFKKIFRKPLVSELYISLYDTARDRKLIRNETCFKAKYYRFIDRVLLEKSDVVIHLSRMELDYIINLVGARKNKISNIHILPLAIDSKELAEPEHSDKFRVCWWGTFIPLHGLDRIIKAFKILQSEKSLDRITFDIFGVPGKKAEEEYHSLIEKLKLNGIVKIHTDKTFANGLLENHLKTKCDLALGNFGSSDKAEIVFCNKIVDAFAMKIPVLTMDSPALKEFVNPGKDLFTCRNNPQEIANAILELQKNRKFLKEVANRGYEVYLKIFSPKKYLTEISKILSKY